MPMRVPTSPIERTAPRRRRLAVLFGTLLVLIGAAACESASAVIEPAATIDGPSEDIVGFGGVAMAEDGTGGVVYEKRVDGVPHVFVARFAGGRWLEPIRVDTEEPFAASWARIGAAEGGRLVVAWATPWATENGRPVEELLGATLGPGANGFGPAILIDPDIRNGTGLSPDLAMSSTGQADLVYRVVFNNLNAQQAAIPLLRAGDVIEDVRVAHYNGETWSRLGAVNRNTGVSVRPPSAANAPHVAIGQTGNGIVVWQEPEIDGVAHIWARRLFGAKLDYVLPVSATRFAGSPIGDDADAPSVAISRLGQAEVAYRQNVSFGSPLPGPRIFLNTLPDGESASGAQFAGAIVADASVSGGKSASIGAPSIDIDEKRDLRLLYDSNGTPRVVQGTGLGLSGALSLGSPFAGGEASSASVMNPVGGGVSAWPSVDPAGAPAVAIREDFANGGVQTGLVRGGAGGPIGELGVGRSGLGDGLVGFQQGAIGDAAIVAAYVSAPPQQLVVTVPNGWVGPSQTVVSWIPAPSANGPLSYRVVLDGHLASAPTEELQAKLPANALRDGAHRVQVLASDIDGQAVLSGIASLRVDARAPAVRIRRGRARRAVVVRVSDAESGLGGASTSVSFGDGTHASGRSPLRHRYARAGTYELVVHAHDRLGNRVLVRRRVRVG